MKTHLQQSAFLFTITVLTACGGSGTTAPTTPDMPKIDEPVEQEFFCTAESHISGTPSDTNFNYTINLYDFKPDLNAGNIMVLDSSWCDNYEITDTAITYTVAYNDRTSADPNNPALEDTIEAEWYKTYEGSTSQAYKQVFNKTNPEKTDWSEYGDVIEINTFTGVKTVTYYEHDQGIVYATEKKFYDGTLNPSSEWEMPIEEYTPELWYPAVRAENDIRDLTEFLGTRF